MPPEQPLAVRTLNAQEETQNKHTGDSMAKLGQMILHYAEEYDVSAEEMTRTLTCESRLDPKSHNTDDPHGGAKGIAQFLPPTFYKYAPKVIETPDIWNTEHQIETMAYMFSQGTDYKRQWVCWRMIYEGYELKEG